MNANYSLLIKNTGVSMLNLNNKLMLALMLSSSFVAQELKAPNEELKQIEDQLLEDQLKEAKKEREMAIININEADVLLKKTQFVPDETVSFDHEDENEQKAFKETLFIWMEALRKLRTAEVHLENESEELTALHCFAIRNNDSFAIISSALFDTNKNKKIIKERIEELKGWENYIRENNIII
jgi:hypothetical protein